jgi:predicted transcriptional regulator
MHTKSLLQFLIQGGETTTERLFKRMYLKGISQDQTTKALNELLRAGLAEKVTTNDGDGYNTNRKVEVIKYKYK